MLELSGLAFISDTGRIRFQFCTFSLIFKAMFFAHTCSNCIHESFAMTRRSVQLLKKINNKSVTFTEVREIRVIRASGEGAVSVEVWVLERFSVFGSALVLLLRLQ